MLFAVLQFQVGIAQTFAECVLSRSIVTEKVKQKRGKYVWNWFCYNNTSYTLFLSSENVKAH